MFANNMSAVYKTLLEAKEDDVLDDATTEKKNKVGEDSLESQETRRMNKLEIDIGSSPRSVEPISRQMESDDESNYSSVPSERV